MTPARTAGSKSASRRMMLGDLPIATARSSIDLASYALTDPIVLDALNAAERRGVVIRVVLDPREHHDFVRLGDLADNAILTVPQGCGGRHRNRDGTGEGAWRMARR